MKKQLPKIFVTGLVFAAVSAAAQPVLTAAGMNIVVGNSYTYATSSTYFAEGPAGASQTWNFASYTGTTGSASPCVTTSSTPYAASFPSANIAVDNGGGTYTYRKTSSTAFQNYGNASASSLMSYSDPEDFLRFPFTYGNTYSDPWSVTFVSGGYTFYRTGHTVVTADGYGTLITAAGTFTNVTRVEFHEIYKDSAYFGMPYIITYDNDEFFWYKDGTHAPLAASFTTTNSTGTGSLQQSLYLVGGLAGVEENGSVSEFSLYPNPATSTVTLSFNLDKSSTLETSVYDVTGKQVQSAVSTDAASGANSINLDVAALPAGIYVAQIRSNGSIAATRRFVVTK